MKSTTRNPVPFPLRLIAVATTLTLLNGCMTVPKASVKTQGVPQATVKIHNTMQVDRFDRPWQASPPGRGSGTGFVISGKRILTNAHVVSNSRFLEVQKNGDPRRYLARVRFAAHDSDLAVLDVDDPAFFDNIEPVTFADTLPALGDTVTAIGFPLGGDRVSITRGVVSRIDHSNSSHSAIDQHLVLQVDAAINPGNSGGPVVFNGRVAGVAFQGLSRGDNIGYAIPVPVIRHVLEDIEDGHYDGYPEIGIDYLELRNPAMRAILGVPDNETGIVISRVDPFGSAQGHLVAGDVLTHIDGHDIAEDGTILLDGNPVAFTELFERRQSGDTMAMRIFREGSEQTLQVRIGNPRDPFVFRNLYDIQPEYAIVGGLVFVPLNREILKTIGNGFSDVNGQRLLYLSQYAKIDGHYRDHEAFVILIRRLPHPVNTYAESFIKGQVVNVNGTPIRGMQDFADALRTPQDGFHVIRFAGTPDPLVLDAGRLDAVQDAILAQYGISSPFNINDGEPQ